MVGKPNLPVQRQNKKNKITIRGSSLNDPGWDALDQERAASMSDEGGVAAVVCEKRQNIARQKKKKTKS